MGRRRFQVPKVDRRKVLIVGALLLGGCAAGPEPSDSPSAERLLEDAGALADPMSLTEAEGQTSTVFRGVENESGFNLHSYLAYHDGLFWAMWSSSQVGEEDPDQCVRYATSTDGHTWSEARILAEDPDGPDQPARWIARGLFLENGKLTALAAYIESADYGKRGEGVVWQNLRLMHFEWDGEAWRDAGVYADNCMSNFPPAMLGGRLAMVCRDDRMNVDLALQEGEDEWKRTPLAADPPFHRMDEPTWYQAGDGTVHMIVRDNNRSRRLIRVISNEDGARWEKPVLTNYPDATSKNYTGKLSNGWYFLINNPNPEQRDPLAISFSSDGWVFERPLALRKNAPPRRFEGRAKPSGSFQYPHAIEQGGSLWVIYSTNKEDIEISEFRISAFGL